jgi:hypothetical protein
MTHDSYCELESSRYQQCKDCMAWAGVQQIHCDWWARVWAWLEEHVPELGDFGSEDDDK